ncbi:AMP-dependent synthetase/ligase [Aquabacterium sp.]|uniref:AMP-dependent synthetase/ligase n=1 Tax=Aquabacterium sp. TaxID=1872578 RepID=UPI002CE567E6|nr:long-chain fatty acid--CoA ligase [Aquabacterium sp.]HSW04916.1 long-chain fatty acid--CoA ligase [Aquabacterium sp.]
MASRIIKTDRPGWVPVALPFDTIPKMFWHRVRQHGDAVMMRQKDLGIWRAYSWRDVAQIVREIGAGLVSLGHAPGEVISVLANTCREWVWTDLAGQSMGGVVNGIYPTDAAAQVEYLCSDSGSVYLFVEDDEQLDKYIEVRERLPLLRKVIVFDMEGLSRLDDRQVIGLDALRELGREYIALHPQLMDERLDSRGPADLAVLVYTSGTTGRPKGAMLSHRNLLSTLAAAPNGLFEGLPEGGERVAFLPLCHIAERSFGEYLAILRSSIINFVENPETVFENLREVQPHAFLAVPRVWEKLYSSVAITIKEAGRLQQLAYGWAIGEGMKMAGHAEAGTRPGWVLRARHVLAKLLVLNNVRRMVGLSRVQLALTGAAPISPALIRWYRALGVPMREVWGMTETSGTGTISPRAAVRVGSIGMPGPGVEMRISEQGEILLRSPSVFTGYLNLPEKTAEAIDGDGWLHTGDVGRVDADGYFYITDRMKDIIITAGGKNITPSEWENQLKFSPYVTDAVVIGDKRAYLSCLVMIDQDNVERWALDRNVQFSDYKSLTRAPEVIALISAEIDKVNGQFARVEQIKQFRLIENQLTAEDEELTPTMKLKRSLVNRKYAALIDSMYQRQAAA